MPKTNISYWKAKLKRNIDKQKEDIRKLRKSGWKVLIIWECQIKYKVLLMKKIAGVLKYEKKNI